MPDSANVEAVKKRFSRIPRWITQKINASKQRMRHDLAQGKGASTLEVIRILRIDWFFTASLNRASMKLNINILKKKV